MYRQIQENEIRPSYLTGVVSESSSFLYDDIIRAR